MVRICALLLLMLVAFCSQGTAQRLTPLHHLTASNSMLTRSEVFRQLQTNIEAHLGNVEKGVKMEILNDQMKLLRETILRKFDTAAGKLEILFNGDTIVNNWDVTRSDANIEIKLNKLVYTIPINEQSFRTAFEAAEYSLGPILQNLLTQAVERSLDDSRGVSIPLFRQAVDAALTVAVNELNGRRGGAWSDQIAAVINAEVQRHLKDMARTMSDDFKTNDKDQWKKWLKTNEKFLPKNLEEGMARAVAASRTLLASGLDQAEIHIRQIVGEFNQILLSANAGLSVSQEKGDLGAGLHVSYTQSSSLQMGVYLSTEFQPDGTSSAQAVVGGQARLAFGNIQLDLLASAIRGEDWGGEAGFGASYSAGNTVIIGLAVFSTFNAVEIQDAAPVQGWSLGMTIRGTSEKSPTLVVGASTISNSGTGPRPLFQIVYPIRPQD